MGPLERLIGRLYILISFCSAFVLVLALSSCFFLDDDDDDDDIRL